MCNLLLLTLSGLLALAVGSPTGAVGFAPRVRYVEPGFEAGNHTRVILGDDAVMFNNPSIVSLQSNSWLFGWSHFCGGVVIDKRHVLTAAHCVDDQPAPNQRVVAGAYRLSDLNNQQMAQIAKIRRHAGFSDSGSSGFPNDIAILFLDRDLQFNQHVQPVSLAREGSSFAGQKCRIAGWGRYSTTSTSSANTLQEVDIEKITNQRCTTLWGNMIGAGHICIHEVWDSSASGPVGPSACSGDSGGPMYCNGVLAGLTSWGHRDCLGEYPSVYTRVSHYLGWIAQQAPDADFTVGN